MRGGSTLLFLFYSLNSDYVPSPLPVNLLYPSQRLLSPTVRALVDYLVPFLNQQKQKW